MAGLWLVGTVPAAVVACERPPGVRDIASNRYYVDGSSSVADPVLMAQREEKIAPLRAFLRETARLADRAFADADREAGACALARLARWAEERALLGTMDGNQAWYDRKWMLAGFALAYLKVKREAAPGTAAVIERWLVDLANVSLTFFDDPKRSRNNHLYWVGLAAGAAAHAAGDAALWARARAILDEGLRDVGADGTLPKEMERKTRALHYHAFAGAPLSFLVLIARARGETPDVAALGRLLAAVAGGVADPARFEALAGARQEVPAGGTLAFLGAVSRHVPPALVIPPERRFYPYLGGRVDYSAAAIGAR